MSYKYLYGPIPSRRLGVSLGIDPIPHKTCPLNCIYCECGATNNFTLERKEYIPTDAILEEISRFLDENPAPDYITFSGSGEPTLHSRLGFMISSLKQKYPHIKIAVLTNSIMLYSEKLQNELLGADLIAPSLDAVTESVFKRIDVPVPGVDIASIPLHLQEFARNFLAQPNKALWMEIFVVEGLNTTPQEIEAFIDVFKNMPYTKIQLNRLDRIGTVRTLTPASMESMEAVKTAFIKAGLHDVEIIGKCKKREEIKKYRHNLEESILETLGRRSHSFDDLMDITGLDDEHLGSYLDVLTAEHKLEAGIIEGRVVYTRLRQ